MTRTVYGLIDPRNEELRYVGVANDPNKRYRQHIYHPTSRVGNWIKSLRADGKKPEMFILDECEGDSWKESERWHINYFRYIGANLTNLIDGGDGGNMPEEVKNKIREARKNQAPLSEESRKKMGDAHRGVPLSEECRAKLSEFHKNQVHTEEWNKNVSVGLLEYYSNGGEHSSGMLGKHHSEETREKLREANLGKKHSDETREKMRKSSKGFTGKHSEETRKKMSESAKKRKRTYGFKFSEESKKKMSESAKNRWKNKEMTFKLTGSTPPPSDYITRAEAQEMIDTSLKEAFARAMP